MPLTSGAKTGQNGLAVKSASKLDQMDGSASDFVDDSDAAAPRAVWPFSAVS